MDLLRFIKKKKSIDKSKQARILDKEDVQEQRIEKINVKIVSWRNSWQTL